MKKVVSLLILSAGFILFSCSGKKTENAAPNADSLADTIIMDYGTVQVDSISPDSAEVAVQDTAVEIIATPETEKAQKK